MRHTATCTVRPYTVIRTTARGALQSAQCTPCVLPRSGLAASSRVPEGPGRGVPSLGIDQRAIAGIFDFGGELGRKVDHWSRHEVSRWGTQDHRPSAIKRHRNGHWWAVPTLHLRGLRQSLTPRVASNAMLNRSPPGTSRRASRGSPDGIPRPRKTVRQVPLGSRFFAPKTCQHVGAAGCTLWPLLTDRPSR